jgi:hypothetical protein
MADASRAARKRRRSGSEIGTDDEGLISETARQIPDSIVDSELEEDVSDDGLQPKQAFEPQTDFTEGELQVRRTRRGVYEGRKAEEEPVVPTSTAGRVRRQANGRCVRILPELLCRRFAFETAHNDETHQSQKMQKALSFSPKWAQWDVTSSAAKDYVAVKANCT